MIETILPHELGENALLYENNRYAVIVPEKPVVSPKEGHELAVIVKQSEKPYYNPEGNIADTVEPFLISLAAARSLLGDPSGETNHLYYQWVNVHILPRFGGKDQFQIEVVGRNARGDTWAQPIKYPETENIPQNVVGMDEIGMIDKELPDNVRDIFGETKDIVLFNDTKEKTVPEDPSTVKSFQNFDIHIPTHNPHVEEGGLHVWISSGRKFEGVFSDVKNGVELYILACATAKKIFEATGMAMEIHFSGNWGLPTEGHWKENLSAHANMYSAPPGKENVALPERPGYIRPDMSEELRAKAAHAVHNIEEYIDEFRGKKIEDLVQLNS